MSERAEQQVLIDRIRHNQGRKESLLKELEKSLDLDALPEDSFEYGHTQIVWEGAVLGVYKKSLTVPQMRDPKIHHRARVQRGVSDGFFVDEIFINEEDIPFAILPACRQMLRMTGSTRCLSKERHT